MAENPNETQTNPDQENYSVATSLSPSFSPSIFPPSSTSPLLNIVATGSPHVAADHTIISLKDTMAMVDDEDTLKRSVENARASPSACLLRPFHLQVSMVAVAPVVALLVITVVATFLGY
ncbi:hypothetical protein AMTR_s00104p00150690 [Amborella trichopoda]|uniref:Uncharacterized protein n=1 Tax=Amborella trichopoda TaxID=13333 RepID=W1NYL9_AMBTC|nr:hypothetical protein AMTR_s00104p00150690 [Amborella trichopoda]